MFDAFKGMIGMGKTPEEFEIPDDFNMDDFAALFKKVKAQSGQGPLDGLKLDAEQIDAVAGEWECGSVGEWGGESGGSGSTSVRTQRTHRRRFMFVLKAAYTHALSLSLSISISLSLSLSLSLSPRCFGGKKKQRFFCF